MFLKRVSRPTSVCFPERSGATQRRGGAGPRLCRRGLCRPGRRRCPVSSGTTRTARQADTPRGPAARAWGGSRFSAPGRPPPVCPEPRVSVHCPFTNRVTWGNMSPITTHLTGKNNSGANGRRESRPGVRRGPQSPHLENGLGDRHCPFRHGQVVVPGAAVAEPPWTSHHGPAGTSGRSNGPGYTNRSPRPPPGTPRGPARGRQAACVTCVLCMHPPWVVSTGDMDLCLTVHGHTVE